MVDQASARRQLLRVTEVQIRDASGETPTYGQADASDVRTAFAALGNGQASKVLLSLEDEHGATVAITIRIANDNSVVVYGHDLGNVVEDQHVRMPTMTDWAIHEQERA
jgi:VCBS repeat-containing protein